VLAQLWQGEGELRPVAVVEGEDDRLGRQGAAVVPGVLDRFQRHRLVAVFVEPADLAVEVGAGDVELRIGGVGGRRPEVVVLEDRHRAGVRFPVGLRRGVANRVRRSADPCRSAPDRADPCSAHPDGALRTAAARADDADQRRYRNGNREQGRDGPQAPPPGLSPSQLTAGEAVGLPAVEAVAVGLLGHPEKRSW
jgi:hypothetical protein